jgi:tetratricopeptide (TPR) repeat protein
MLFQALPTLRHLKKMLIGAFLLLAPISSLGYAQSGSSRKPELIIDTDIANENEKPPEPEKPKELNPKLAKQNIGIGNQYFKSKNYSAAISRYLDALAYQPDSILACDALGRAYEKNGDKAKALDLYSKFLEKNPNSSISSEFRARIARLTEQALKTTPR